MSLQVWLPLNGDLHNQGLSGLTATYNSGATVNNSGKIGKCYSFTTSQLIQTTLPSQVTSPIGSIACWVKFNAFPASGQYLCLLKLGNVGSGYGSSFLSLWISGGNIYVVARGKDPVSADQITNPLSTNTWYHLTATYDGTTAKIYSNGVQIYTKTLSGGSLTNANYFLVGASNANTAASPNPNYGLNGYLNDVRYYDHCLSPKEVEEIAKGLVLHYKLDDKFCEPTKNLITSVTAGGRTSVSNNILTTSGTNEDTYFTLNTSENIVSGTQYTISCYAEIPSGYVWNFPLGAQSNTALLWTIHNGYNEKTFTANSIDWGTNRIFMDDTSSSTARTGQVVTKMYNFQLEKKDHATGFAGYGIQRGAQYDKNIYKEPDGSLWLHIAHHNNPSSSGYFTQSATWAQGVYINADKWYDVDGVLAQVSRYEFMVKQKTTSSATEAKYRWIQNKNPLTATWNDVKPGTITVNTSSGYTSSSYGGLWQMNSYARLCIANATSSNWFGAFGCWSTYSTNKVPGYPNTEISTGYMDLYVNITDTDLYKVYDSSGYSNNGTISGTLTAAAPSPRYDVATVFNGSSYITIPFSQQCLVDSFTISAWFYSESTANNKGVGGFHTSSNPTTGGICFGQWGSNSLIASIGNGSSWTAVTFGNSSLNNNWHHIVCTYTKSQKLIGYLDGEKVQEVSVGILTPVTTNGFAIGRAYDASNRIWTGKIVDVRCYSTALTAGQVADLYRTSMSIDSSGNVHARELVEL